jgi:hypothetical protein
MERTVAATVASLGPPVRVRVRRSSRTETLGDAPDNLRVGDRVWCDRRQNDPFPRFRDLVIAESRPVSVSVSG